MHNIIYLQKYNYILTFIFCALVIIYFSPIYVIDVVNFSITFLWEINCLLKYKMLYYWLQSIIIDWFKKKDFILSIYFTFQGLWASQNLPAMHKTKVQLLDWEEPLERREWILTPVFLPGEFHGQRSLENYSPWVTKSWTWLTD